MFTTATKLNTCSAENQYSVEAVLHAVCVDIDPMKSLLTESRLIQVVAGWFQTILRCLTWGLCTMTNALQSQTFSRHTLTRSANTGCTIDITRGTFSRQTEAAILTGVCILDEAYGRFVYSTALKQMWG